MLIMSISAVKLRLGLFCAGDRAFVENGMAETEKFRRPPASVGTHFACLFDKVLLLDEAAEILLVDEQASQSLDGALQL